MVAQLATKRTGAKTKKKKSGFMTSCPRCQRSFDDGVRFCPVDGTQGVPAASDRNIGRVLLGQFELRELCGRGAMGTVYLAYQHAMDRVVAIKILRPELQKEPDV